jgi:hypothetical protein
VGRHELLLLADGVEEAEGVDAEADQTEHDEGPQPQSRAGGHLQALARPRGGEHQEGQNDPRRHLDPHAGHQRGRAGPQARLGPRRQGERERQREQDQRVVVRPADSQHQEDRVQTDEGRGPPSRAAEPPCRSCDQRHGAQARGRGERLQDPQAGGEPQGRGRVAHKGEEGPVGGVLEGPADELEDRIGACFGRDVGVGVEPVQGPHASERQIAEDVLGDQRRPEEQEHVGEHDPGGKRTARQAVGRDEHEQVARAHDQHQRLKATARQARAETFQRARQPVRPAADAGRDVFRGFRGGVGAQH